MADPSPSVIPGPSPCCYQHLPPPEESPPPPVSAPVNSTVKYDESEQLSLNDRGRGVDVPSPSHTSPRPPGAPPCPPPATLPPDAAGSHAGPHTAGSRTAPLPHKSTLSSPSETGSVPKLSKLSLPRNKKGTQRVRRSQPVQPAVGDVLSANLLVSVLARAGCHPTKDQLTAILKSSLISSPPPLAPLKGARKSRS